MHSSLCKFWCLSSLQQAASSISILASSSGSSLATSLFQNLPSTHGSSRGYASKDYIHNLHIPGAQEGPSPSVIPNSPPVKVESRAARQPTNHKTPLPYFVGLYNLRTNPGAMKKAIRVGRGDAARRGNTCGRGQKGKKARSRVHILHDGGKNTLLKVPVTRTKASYETFYAQVSLSTIVEYVQLGLLDPTRVITMRDLYDTGAINTEVRYGVRLYGKARFNFPLHVQVTSVTEEARQTIEKSGGTVSRVYYTKEGLEAVVYPSKYIDRNLPLPLPAVCWHPKFNDKFDVIGMIPPVTQVGLPAGIPKPQVIEIQQSFLQLSA